PPTRPPNAPPASRHHTPIDDPLSPNSRTPTGLLDPAEPLGPNRPLGSNGPLGPNGHTPAGPPNPTDPTPTGMLDLAGPLGPSSGTPADPPGPEARTPTKPGASTRLGTSARLGTSTRPGTAAGIADAAREAISADHPAAGALLSLAELLAVSPYQLSRAFTREVGVSLTHYRNRVRVGRALDQLEDGATSLAELAADLGFADQAHLTRTIRRHTGHTPTALRRLLASPEGP
ncbi:helix-turn-helix domain-containing protein, partial [Nonomuraea zeae]